MREANGFLDTKYIKRNGNIIRMENPLGKDLGKRY